MTLFAILQTAWGGITTNKSRSLLTVLGIVIGIASVMLMLAVGQNAKSLIIEQVSSFGSDTLFIEPGNAEESGPPIGADFTILKYDAAMRLKELPEVELVAPMIFLDANVVYGENDKRVRIVGTTPDNQDIDNAYPLEGRFFDESELRSREHVAVLGYNMANILFDGEDALGKSLKINRVNFKVIGIMEEQGTKFFQNLDEQIYIPVTTAQKEVFGINYVNFISVAVSGDIDVAREAIRASLRDFLKIHNPTQEPAKDGFRIASQVDAIEMVSIVTNILTLLLASIAAISLLVGGIGIMNIMLVSVSERTQEIGLRKALGATPKDITRQFLTESVVLTLTGGILGILSGFLFSYLIVLIAKYFAYEFDFIIPWGGMLAGFLVAFFVGLIFGIYPARRASRLDPIQSLRYE